MHLPLSEYPSLSKRAKTAYEKSEIKDDTFLLFTRKSDGMVCVGLAVASQLPGSVRVKVFSPLLTSMHDMMDKPLFVEDFKSGKKTVMVQIANVYAPIMEHNVVYANVMASGKETLTLLGRARYLYQSFYKKVIQEEFPEWEVTQEVAIR